MHSLFSASVEKILLFSLRFIKMVENKFSNSKPYQHFWNKSHFVYYYFFLSLAYNWNLLANIIQNSLLIFMKLVCRFPICVFIRFMSILYFLHEQNESFPFSICSGTIKYQWDCHIQFQFEILYEKNSYCRLIHQNLLVENNVTFESTVFSK